MKITVTKRTRQSLEYFELAIFHNNQKIQGHTFGSYDEVIAFEAGFSAAKNLANSLIQSLPSVISIVQPKKWVQISNVVDNYDGHTFWKDGSGKVAIADKSMRYKASPETTADGLLFVDTDRFLKAFPGGKNTIPLISEEGKKSDTLGSKGDIALCMQNLGMKFEKF